MNLRSDYRRMASLARSAQCAQCNRVTTSAQQSPWLLWTGAKKCCILKYCVNAQLLVLFCDNPTHYTVCEYALAWLLHRWQQNDIEWRSFDYPRIVLTSAYEVAEELVSAHAFPVGKLCCTGHCPSLTVSAFACCISHLSIQLSDWHH